MFNLNSIYFTSAEQGGVSVDRLNKKIQHEYALIVQDTFPQATNFRSYFIEGAIKTIQEQCSQVPQARRISQKTIAVVAASIAGISLISLSIHHYKNAHLLDEASKELITYDNLNSQGNPQALYHLSKAAASVDHIASNTISLPMLQQLKVALNKNAQSHLKENFLPVLANELEQTIINPTNTPVTRYKALKFTSC